LFVNGLPLLVHIPEPRSEQSGTAILDQEIDDDGDEECWHEDVQEDEGDQVAERQIFHHAEKVETDGEN
jgi:hypothetical protein